MTYAIMATLAKHQNVRRWSKLTVNFKGEMIKTETREEIVALADEYKITQSETTPIRILIIPPPQEPIILIKEKEMIK